MAIVSLQALIERATEKYSITQNEASDLFNRGFIVPVEGTPSLYDDYFVAEKEVFDKIHNEYVKTKDYLTPYQMSSVLAEQGVNIPAGALEKMALGSDLEAYKITSTNRILFSPDILLNIEDIKNAYKDFEAREEQEELDEMELFAGVDDTQEDETEKSDESDKNPDEDIEYWDDEPNAKKGKKRKQPAQTSGVHSEQGYPLPPVDSVSPPATYEPDKSIPTSQPFSVPQPQVPHPTNSQPAIPTGAFGAAFAASAFGVDTTPAPPAHQPPKAAEYPTDNKPNNAVNTDFNPTSNGTVGSKQESYDDYLKRQENERRFRDSLETESKPTYQSGNEQRAPSNNETPSSKDATGSYVFGGYAKGETYVEPATEYIDNSQAVSTPESSKSEQPIQKHTQTTVPIFTSTVEYITSEKTPQTSPQIQKADDFVVKAQIAEIASQNVISEKAIVDVIDYARTNNETISIPMADGSYLKVEPVQNQTETTDNTPTQSDYRVSLVEHNADATSVEQKILYSSEVGSTHNNYMSIFDTYASGMQAVTPNSDPTPERQTQTDTAVLYAIGVPPHDQAYSLGVQSHNTEQYVAVVPASVTFIHPNILNKFEDAGIHSISYEQPKEISSEPQKTQYSYPSTGTEQPIEIRNFNKTYVQESAVVSSAFLGNDEQIREAINQKVAETGSLQSVINNGASFKEQNDFAHKVLISDIATNTTVSEQALTHIADVVRENKSTVVLPLKNGETMVFEGGIGEQKNDYRVILNSPTNGDYSQTSSRLIFSSEATERDAVRIGDIYQAYSQGMGVEKLTSVATEYTQQTRDKQVLYAIGAVSAKEINITKDGTVTLPKDVTYVNHAILARAEARGAQSIIIDNQPQTITALRSKAVPLPKEDVTESVYLGNYDKIQKVTNTAISQNFKDIYVTDPKSFNIKTTAANNPLAPRRIPNNTVLAGGVTGGMTTAARTIVMPKSIAANKTSAGAEQAGTIIGTLAINEQNNHSQKPVVDSRGNPAVANTSKAVVRNSNGQIVMASRVPVKAMPQTPIIKDGDSTFIKTKYGYKSLENSTDGGSKRVNIELFGTAAQTTSLLKPVNSTGLEAQAARANTRFAARTSFVNTYVDLNGRTHLKFSVNSAKQRVEMSKHIASQQRVVSASSYTVRVSARVATPKTVNSAMNWVNRKIAYVKAYSPRVELRKALQSGDFTNVLNHSKTLNMKAAAKMPTDSNGAIEPIIMVGLKGQELAAQQEDAKAAMIMSLFRQFGRMSGVTRVNNYTFSGLKAIFGYSSPLNIAIDFGAASAASGELFNLQTRVLNDLLIDDMNTLAPDLIKGLDLTKLKGRGQLRKRIGDLSKKSFGTDITRFSSYKIREILKSGKYKGVELTTEQRQQLIATLRLQGFQYRDFSAFDIVDNLKRKGINISGTYNLGKVKDIKKLMAELEKNSSNFAVLLNGLSFKDLSIDQIKALAENISGNVPKSLQALAASYLTGNELLKAHNLKKVTGRSRFSRLTLLLRRVFGNSYTGVGVNLIVNVYEYVRLAKLINKSVVPVVKRLYNKSLGRVVKKLKSIYNKTLGKAVKLAQNGVKTLVHNTKAYKRMSSGAGTVRSHIQGARRRVTKTISQGKNAVAKSVKAGKMRARNGIRNTVNKNSKLRKATHQFKAANKQRKIASSKVKAKLKDVGTKFKRVGNAIAKPFRFLSQPLDKLAKLKGAAGKALSKALGVIIKVVAIVLGVLTALLLITGIIMAMASTIQGIIWNYEELPIIGDILPVDRNGNGVDDREEDNLDLTVFFHNDDKGRVVSGDECDNSGLDESGNLVCLGHANSEATLMNDRVEFCIGMDSALKVYTQVMCDEESYDSSLFEGTKNTAVQEVLDCDEVKAEEDNWFDPNEGKNINIKNLGCKIDGVQTGIYYSYYDGDGNEIGLQSNAKDIVAVASTWQYENYKAKGLFKSYVEKLWCYSHAVTYMPRSYGGKFIYKCDLGSSSPCGEIDDTGKAKNTYTWECNDSSAKIYGDDNELLQVQANVDLDTKYTNSDGVQDYLYHYKENGCNEHIVTYHGGRGTQKSTKSQLQNLGCTNIKSLTVSSGTNGTTKKYYCAGCSDCDSHCSDTKTYLGGTTFHNAFEIEYEDGSIVSYYDWSDACDNYTYTSYTYNNEVTEIIPPADCPNWSSWFNSCGCSDANHTGVEQTVLVEGEVYRVQCLGHRTQYELNECTGYCDGHTITYCTGHIDLDITIVTLFLDDNNGLTKLGVPKSVTTSIEEYDTNNTIAPLMSKNVKVEVQTPVLPDDLSVDNIESDYFLYTHVDKFKSIKRNIGTGNLLPLPDPDYIKDDIKLKLSEIENVQFFTNQTVDTLRFMHSYTQGEYPYDTAFTGYSNLDELVGSYFSKFATHQWQDANDQGSVDSANFDFVLNALASLGLDASGIVNGIVNIQHYAGIYEKFGKGNVFEGWYTYGEDGKINSTVDDDGNIVYCDYGNVSRAEAMASDDWKEFYYIDFPGAVKGAISQTDMALLQNIAQNLHGNRAGNIANRILNSLPHESTTGGIDEATNYSNSPRSNTDYVQSVYSQAGLTPAYGAVPPGISDKDAVKWLYSNNKTKQFSSDINEAKQTVSELRTGDLILIGDEIYMVLYNTGYVLPDETTKYPVGKEAVEEGTIVVTTVAGGGTPRLVAYRCETFFNSAVGFGYIKCNY